MLLSVSSWLFSVATDVGLKILGCEAPTLLARASAGAPEAAPCFLASLDRSRNDRGFDVTELVSAATGGSAGFSAGTSAGAAATASTLYRLGS